MQQAEADRHGRRARAAASRPASSQRRAAPRVGDRARGQPADDHRDHAPSRRRSPARRARRPATSTSRVVVTGAPNSARHQSSPQWSLTRSERATSATSGRATSTTSTRARPAEQQRAPGPRGACDSPAGAGALRAPRAGACSRAATTSSDGTEQHELQHRERGRAGKVEQLGGPSVDLHLERRSWPGRRGPARRRTR